MFRACKYLRKVEELLVHPKEFVQKAGHQAVWAQSSKYFSAEHQHHMGTWKCKFLGPTQDQLNQKFCRWA